MKKELTNIEFNEIYKILLYKDELIYGFYCNGSENSFFGLNNNHNSDTDKYFNFESRMLGFLMDILKDRPEIYININNFRTWHNRHFEKCSRYYENINKLVEEGKLERKIAVSKYELEAALVISMREGTSVLVLCEELGLVIFINNLYVNFIFEDEIYADYVLKLAEQHNIEYFKHKKKTYDNMEELVDMIAEGYCVDFVYHDVLYRLEKIDEEIYFYEYSSCYGQHQVIYNQETYSDPQDIYKILIEGKWLGDIFDDIEVMYDC